MSYIVATKKEKVLSVPDGSAGSGVGVVINKAQGDSGQFWTFLFTTMPGVFYIAAFSNSSYVLTVPDKATNGSKPTLQERKEKHDSHQLWRLIPSSDGANSMIQNYSTSTDDGNGLVLDTHNGNAQGQVTYLWSRCDNDNQKWYFQTD